MEKESKITPSVTTYLYRPTKSTWRLLDGATIRENDEEIERGKVGTNWINNSCAVDCVVAVTIQLQLWRVQGDQVEPRRLQDLELPATLLRILALSPWGRLAQEQRDELRDIVREGLALYDNTNFSTSAFMSVGWALDACLQGVPQLGWTEAKISCCCDGKQKMEKRAPNRAWNMFLMHNEPQMDVTLEQEITSRMQHCAIVEEDVLCSRGDQCKKERTIFSYIVLDRMPPMLLVHAGHPIREGESKIWKIFDIQKVDYFLREGEKRSVRYEAACAIFLVNNDHFIVRIKMAEADEKGLTVKHIDGSSSRMVRHWWSHLAGRTAKAVKYKPGVLAIFYRMIFAQDATAGTL